MKTEMKVLPFEDKGIGECVFCKDTIPSRRFVVFRHEENKTLICHKCAQAITRAFIQDTFGLDNSWQVTTS